MLVGLRGIRSIILGLKMYMPALMRAEGYDVEFRDVNHRERGAGTSKYTNFGRLWAALSDLRGVTWLIRRRRNPSGADEF